MIFRDSGKISVRSLADLTENEKWEVGQKFDLEKREELRQQGNDAIRDVAFFQLKRRTGVDERETYFLVLIGHTYYLWHLLSEPDGKLRGVLEDKIPTVSAEGDVISLIIPPLTSN